MNERADIDDVEDAGDGRIDPRRIFLLSAAIRHEMLERGEMTIDEAVSDDFIENFRWIGGLVCYCEYEIMQRMDAVHRQMDEERRDAEWRQLQQRRSEKQRPAKSTLDAYDYVQKNHPEKLAAWLRQHPEVKP